ncbi:MAG: hypothetical protein AAGF79_02830 [Pseudomonadota bacterium]
MAKVRFAKKFGTRGGSLLMIAVLLAGSGLIRVVTQAGPALAKATSDEAVLAAEQPMMSDKEQDPDETVDRTALQTMLDAFRQREARIAEQERLLEERSYALDVADKAVTRKLQELIEAEAALRETLSLADGAVDKDIARLTVVYETMKPKEAAALFEEMAPEFAAGFLARMRPEAAAQIMTGLSAEAAYTISVVLAGRNSRAPIE